MGFAKLREWVGTVTGKGVRWGRDRIGRSAPAFLSTTALPPLTCTAKGRRHLAAVVLLRGRPSVAVCFEACAGRRVFRLCLPAVPCSAGFLFACCHLCLPCPLPFSTSCPRSFAQVCLPPFSLLCPVQFICFVFFPCSFHVRQDHRLLGPAVCLQGQQFASCKTVPLAAATRACSGGPCTGSIFDSFFFLQSP